jgi:hypothetical protein
MIFKFEYLGEFEFIFKNSQRYESEDQDGALIIKKSQKSRASVPLRKLRKKNVALEQLVRFFLRKSIF